MTPTIEDIARICHDANRAYCDTVGDSSQPPWIIVPQWQRDSAIAGVQSLLDYGASPEECHASWMKQKKEDGWVFGPKKDPERKEHPCMVPYADLPVEQKLKDHLFRAIVTTLTRSSRG